MNAGERDFLEPGRAGDRSHFLDHVSDGDAAARATGRRNDAVAAALLTAGLHPQSERGAAGDAGRDRRTARPVAIAEPHAGRQLALALEQPNEIELLVVRHDAEDASAAARRPPRTRRVTAGDDDAGGGIVAGDATDRLPRALVGRGGDRAGIHDDQIGGARRRRSGRPAARRSSSMRSESA